MAGVTVTPAQVYAEVIAQGGNQTQAQVAAALVDGIESTGNTLELADGVGPAQGLFQFEPGTWTGGAGGGKNGLPSTVAAATWQQQVTGFINSTGGAGGDNFSAWGPDLGAGSGVWNWTGGPAAGSPVATKIAALSGSGSFGTNAAITPGGGGSDADAGIGGGAPTTNGALDTTTENIPGFGTQSVTEQEATALDTMTQTLQAYGFSSAQASAVVSWAWPQMTQSVDVTQILTEIQTPGSAIYPVFAQVYPGFVAANEQLIAQGLPAVSVGQYSSYQQSAEAYAQAAGLPPGMITSQNVGALVGGNVSLSELSSRLNDATSLAINSTPEQRAMFNQYFGTFDQYVTADNPYGTGADAYNASGGLTTGQIAALVLDPKASEPLIHQQITAAQIGGAGVTAGIGAITQPEAVKLAQAGITDAQATSQFAQIGQLAPLETALPGMHGNAAAQQVISPDVLAEGNLLGTAADVRAQQVAQESRKAPFTGGGGFVQSTKGAVGTGSASGTGSGQ